MRMSIKNNEIEQERIKKGKSASFVGIVANCLLAVSKLIIGFSLSSLSIIADGLNNFSDTASSLISYFSILMSGKPKDKKHPFGHGRAEYVGTLFVGLLIFSIGVELFKSGIKSFFEEKSFSMSSAGIIVLCVSIVFKIIISIYFSFVGKKYSLDSLIAASKDSFIDAIISLSILLSLSINDSVARVLDGPMCLVIAVFIFISSWKILNETISSLLGENPDKDAGKNILSLVKSKGIFSGYHDFIIHDYGKNNKLASIHLSVDKKIDSKLVSECVEELESECIEKLKIPICIHVDMSEMSKEEKAYLRAVNKILSEHNFSFGIHDFVVKNIDNKKHISFHLSIPADVKNIDDILKDLEQHVNSLYNDVVCDIDYDFDYFV